MKQIILLLLLSLPFTVLAQKSKIEFEKLTHDFGDIVEEDGSVTYDFVFKNTGRAPLLLTNVRAGCGCTTPEWSREPIPPGQTGKVKVSFNPTGRPGNFFKSVTVTTNAEDPVATLRIRGNVVKRNATPYDNYKFNIGKLKAKSNTVNIGRVNNTQKIERTIDIINPQNQPLTIKKLSNTPGIHIKIEPATLEKEQKGKIHITYDAAQRNAWGFIIDQVDFDVNGSPEFIKISANIYEDFSSYNNDFKDAPAVTLSEEATTLQDLKKSTPYTHEFYIENTGKNDLSIRNIKTSGNDISLTPAKTVVKAGKKLKATLSFTTPENSGKKTHIIQITTNDPKRTVVVYKLTTEVN